MKTKTMIRLCAAVLSILMLLATFAGCQTRDDNPATTSEKSTTTDAGTETERETETDAPKKEKRVCRYSEKRVGGVKLGDFALEDADNPKNKELADWLYEFAGIDYDAESDYTIRVVEDRAFLYNEVQIQVTGKTIYLVSSAFRQSSLAVAEWFQNEVMRSTEDEISFSENKRTWVPEEEASAPSAVGTTVREVYCSAESDRTADSYLIGDSIVFAVKLIANDALASCSKFAYTVTAKTAGTTLSSGTEKGKYGVLTVRVPVKSNDTYILTVTPQNSKGENILKTAYTYEVGIKAESYSAKSFWLNSLIGKPTVFAVEDTYQIFVPTESGNVMWVEVNGVKYYDQSNGIAKSDTLLHKMVVPMKELDSAKKYRLGTQTVTERRAYNSVLQEAAYSEWYTFKPINGTDCNIYQIADAHGMKTQVLDAVRYYEARCGEIDLLILNGDLISTSENLSVFNLIYQLTWEIAKGEIPVVFSRGNHDLRGKVAEKLSEYTPVSSTGKTYYTVSLGSLWLMVLDAGEDKLDNHPEYGGTVACHLFRQEQTEWIKSVIADRENEYAAPGVQRRMVICHYYYHWNRYKVESDIYNEWVTLLNRIAPDMALQGHYHEYFIHYPKQTLTLADGSQKAMGTVYPIVIGSKVSEGSYFAGCGVQLSARQTVIVFSDSEKILQEKILIDANGRICQ